MLALNPWAHICFSFVRLFHIFLNALLHVGRIYIAPKSKVPKATDLNKFRALCGKNSVTSLLDLQALTETFKLENESEGKKSKLNKTPPARLLGNPPRPNSHLSSWSVGNSGGLIKRKA